MNVIRGKAPIFDPVIVFDPFIRFWPTLYGENWHSILVGRKLVHFPYQKLVQNWVQSTLPDLILNGPKIKNRKLKQTTESENQVGEVTM